MDEHSDSSTTPAQAIARLNALQEVAEATRDRLRILVANVKRNDGMGRRQPTGRL